jgi:hypothetical protein
MTMRYQGALAVWVLAAGIACGQKPDGPQPVVVQSVVVVSMR